MKLIDRVNIEVGTDSIYRQSSGNTLPNVQYPFGNQSYVLQTDGNGGGWFYNPKHNFIEGIRVSSQPSPWLGDYGHIVVQPISGTTNFDNGGRHSSISNKQLSPAKLSIHLNRYNIDFNLVPAKNSAIFTVDYKDPTNSNKLLIKGLSGKCKIEVEDDTVYLQTDFPRECEYSENFKKYYVIKFNCEISNYDLFKENQIININEEHNLGILLEFASDSVSCKLGSSYISFMQASTNIANDINEKILSEVYTETCNAWEELLSTIKVEDEEEKLEVFYSNLYRCFCYPRGAHETTPDGIKHRSFADGKIYDGTMYTDVGFWDTYRTTMPLLRLITPAIYKEIIQSILNFYREYQWLPRWVSPFERGIMPSTLTDSVIAEAIVTNNIEAEDLDLALEGLLKDAYTHLEDDLHGRRAINEYIKYGYIPHDLCHESVSMTLDNAYSDYAIAKALEHVGKKAEADKLYKRAANYKTLFNPETKFFESKLSNGEFRADFDPNEWGTDFCESSGWSNNLSVFHDFEGLTNLFGSIDNIETRLDEIINQKIKYTTGKYGFEIHEMTEAAICSDLGYFAISNQPSFNLPFVYHLIGKEEKYIEIIKRAHNYFKPTGDGYPGDEDNGSLSAWYVLTVIGKYPYCPADGEFLELPKMCLEVEVTPKK